MTPNLTALIAKVEELDREATKGPWTYDPQDGVPGHCYMAQVWDPGGRPLTTVEPTVNPNEACASVELIALARTLLPAMVRALGVAQRDLQEMAEIEYQGCYSVRRATDCLSEIESILSEVK